MSVFRLQYAENVGAFLSLSTTLPEEIRILAIQVIVEAGLIALFIWLLGAQARSHLFVLALGLVLAGEGINLIDRLLHHGRVIDFMTLGIGPLRTGIYDFADAFITVGGVVLVWLSYRQEHPVKQTEMFWISWDVAARHLPCFPIPPPLPHRIRSGGSMHRGCFSHNSLDFRPNFGKIPDGSIPLSKSCRACLTERKETIKEP